MGLFTKKPDRALQAEIIKQANGAMNVLGYALTFKKTNPAVGMESQAIDLTKKKNRDLIRDKLVRLVREQELAGCTEGEISARLVPLLMDQLKTPIEDAALSTAVALNSVNIITRLYYEDYPNYQPLYEMVDNLAKMGCAGAAQIVGKKLPPEVAETWPYFARIFTEAKRSNVLTPDV